MAVRARAADRARHFARHTELGARSKLSYSERGSAEFASSDRAYANAVHPTGPSAPKQLG